MDDLKQACQAFVKSWESDWLDYRLTGDRFDALVDAILSLAQRIQREERSRLLDFLDSRPFSEEVGVAASALRATPPAEGGE